MSPRTDHTEALHNWPRPENVSELRSFLGLIGFLHRYIRDFAQIAVSLIALLKKGAPWQWDEVVCDGLYLVSGIDDGF